MTEIHISVIITILNEETTLSSLLESLRTQTIQPQKIIIVDGGSSDASVSVIARYIEKYPDFKLEVCTKKGNRSAGRNFAINQVATPLVAITDAGCIPAQDWLEKLYQKYQEKHTPVIAGYYTAKPQTPFEAAVVPYVLVMPDRVDENNFLPATRSMLLEKAVWQKVGGFNESLNDNEDYAFAHELRKQNVQIAFAREAVVQWLPGTNLKDFFWMIFRFARGDVFAGIVRPKVVLVFARYVCLLVLCLSLGFLAQWFLLAGILLTGFCAYSLWAIKKNIRYARNGWYWLPVLQIGADVGVILGSLVGFYKLLTK